MRLQGEERLEAPIHTVFTSLTDPRVLSKTLPGLQSLEPTDANTYRARLSVGIAAVRGTFDGMLSLRELEPPTAYTLYMTARGAGGVVEVTLRVHLAEDEDSVTRIVYTGEAALSGVWAALGSRMASGVAQTMMRQFFMALHQEVRSSASAATS